MKNWFVDGRMGALNWFDIYKERQYFVFKLQREKGNEV